MGAEPVGRDGTRPGAATRTFPRPRRIRTACRRLPHPERGCAVPRRSPPRGPPAPTEPTQPVVRSLILDTAPRGIARPRPSPPRGPPSLMETRHPARPCVPDGRDRERTGREDHAAVPAGSGRAHGVPVPRVSTLRAGRDCTGLRGGISLPARPGGQPEGQLPARFIYLFRHRVINL